MVQYAHDIMDRVTNISWRTSNGATLGGFAYEYDAVGRITSRSHALGDPSQPSPMSQSSQKTYAYDDFDRLASDGDIAYTYDAAGNRMTRTEDGDTITYTLGVGDRLASYGRAASTMPPQSGAYTHDAAGNVTRIERDGRPTLDLTWNSQYQLVSVSTNGVFAESYAYDALSRRVSTTTLEGTTRHVYNNNWQCIADIDENGDVVASYTWGEGVDKLLAVTVGGATFYALTDIQGTVWGYTDSQNNVVASWQYDAWGNVLSEEIDPSAAALATLRHRFQGREWSAATGLINFRMRWYDAETGRWLSKDPIGISGGLNLYAFCSCTPLISCDAFGLRKSPEPEKDIIRTKELLTGGDLILDAYVGCELHGGGKPMDYAAVDPSSKWNFPFGVTRNPNQMGNYMAGYDAGYSRHPSLMYAGVRVGGMFYGAQGGSEGWRDSGSVPDINAGFSDGVVDKAMNDAISDPFVQTILGVLDLLSN